MVDISNLLACCQSCLELVDLNLDPVLGKKDAKTVLDLVEESMNNIILTDNTVDFCHSQRSHMMSSH